MFLMLLSLLAVSLVCSFYGSTLIVWTISFLVCLMLFGASGAVSWLGVSITAVIFAVVAIPLNHIPLRQKWLSAVFLKEYIKMVPTLSSTEQVALDAGTVGWEGELFAGKPNWKKLQAIPHLELSVEEKAFIEGPLESLCDMLNPWENSHQNADLDPPTWQFLKDNKFFGMIIPKEYGGLGFSALAHRAVLQKIASICPITGTHVAVPNSLGPGELLVHYGTAEQKSYFLPRLASGEDIPCFGLTGPTAGSDATSIPDVGMVCEREYKGKKTVGISLTFDKRYITLAPVATLIGLAFRMVDPDGLLGGETDLGISLALVPRDTAGVEIGSRHFPLNVPFQNGPIRGKDVFVPLDALVGGVERAGQGWKMLIELLSIGRAITLPSSSTGGVKLAALATGAYARIRKQFNMPIGRFEGIEAALARIAGNTYATSALSRMTATAVDLGEKPAVPSAIAKYHATEKAREVITDAMDIHGGKGVILGPRNYLGRGWQGIPVWITVEGANILTRSMMIFGQGAIRCHPYLLKEMDAVLMADKQEQLTSFDKLLFAHVGYTIRNGVRSMILGMSFGKFATVPKDRQTSKYYQKLSRYSASLAFTSDIVMLTLGGKLKQKEHISARLGDVLSHLYICSAMLKRYESIGRPAADQAILAWAFHDAIYKIQIALRLVIDNFPNLFMRTLLRMVVFPLGRRERAPSDRLTHKAAQLLLAPSDTRIRLCDGIYTKARAGHPVGMMEQALTRIIAAEPLERKLLKALKQHKLSGITWNDQLQEAVEKKVVTTEEAAILVETREMMLEIIAVDEFEDEDIQLGRQVEEKLKRQNAA